MKRIFQVIAVLIAVGAMVQTISAAQRVESASGSKGKETVARGREGEPGV